MTSITFKGSSRILGVSILGASLLLGGTMPAAAAEAAKSTESTTSTPQSTESPAAADDSAPKDLEVTLDIQARVQASKQLVIPVSLTAIKGTETTVSIVHAANQQEVAGTSTTVKAEEETIELKLDGSKLEPGKYIVRADDGETAPKSSKEFVVEAPDEASEAPKTEDAPDKGKAAEDVPLDQFYPELAKEKFKQEDGTYKIPAPKAGAKGAGNIPAGLEAYYNQDVELSGENCQKLGYPDYTQRIGRTPECGYLIAPIDAKDPSAGNVAIAMMKVAAGKVVNGQFEKTKPQGTVAWNPGGPGGSGMTLSVAGALNEPDLAANFDLVGFDPRGTGSSMPVSQCSTDEQLDQDRAEDAWAGNRDDAEDILNGQAERFAEDCIKNTGKLFDLGQGGQENLMKHIGTWDAVGDLDLIRSTSQDDKLDFIGFSYGTRLGYVYAQKFPKNVGRLVLDGAVDPGNVAAYKALKDINKDPQTYIDKNGKVISAKVAKQEEEDPDDSVNQIAGFQGTFEQFALDCSAKGTEGKTWAETYPGLEFPDRLKDLENQKFTCALGDGIEDSKDGRAQLTANVQKILQSLEGNPLPTGDPADNREVTFGDARTGAIQALYSETLWSRLALGLTELQAGQSAGELNKLADEYNERDETGHYDPLLQAFTNIRCTDENSNGNKPDLNQLRDLAERYDKAGPFQAASVSPGVYDYCDFWKFKGTLPKPEKLTAVPNILVVSTSHDSATPYASGVKLARIIDGSLLSVSGASHTSYMKGDESLACVDSTVNTYLTDGSLPPQGDFGPKLPKPDTAVDDRGDTITLPNKCKMDTFRSDDFTVSPDEVKAGESVQAAISHLGSEQTYTVAFESGDTLGTLTTDNGGNAKAKVTVPKGTKPGTYVVQLLDADGKVVGTTVLTVVGDDDSKGSDGDGDDPKGGSDVKPSDTGKDGTPGAGGGGNLPRTGAEIWPLLAGALALVAAGSAAYGISRRRKSA